MEEREYFDDGEVVLEEECVLESQRKRRTTMKVELSSNRITRHSIAFSRRSTSSQEERTTPSRIWVTPLLMRCLRSPLYYR